MFGPPPCAAVATSFDTPAPNAPPSPTNNEGTNDNSRPRKDTAEEHNEAAISVSDGTPRVFKELVFS